MIGNEKKEDVNGRNMKENISLPPVAQKNQKHSFHLIKGNVWFQIFK